MAVYVDYARNPFGRMKMCHMLADTEEELHAMADKIGVKRKWFQKHASAPHYDICQTKRELAVSYGAIQVSDRKHLVEIIRRARTSDV